MSYNLMYLRDHIQVNQDFVDRLNKKITNAHEATLLVAARNFKHDAGYVWKLPGYNLVLLADQYDSNGGMIDASGQPGTDGPSGHPGTKGYATAGATGKKGGPGGPGGPGEPGTNGTNVTLFCKNLLNAYILSNGGTGGKGGAGGDGGHGGDGRLGHASGRLGPGLFETIHGTDGGNGGSGGNGNRGGNAGLVTVEIYQLLGPAFINTWGGSGGASGKGGAGGKGGALGGHNGMNGQQGNAGFKGNDVHNTILGSDEQTFWNRLRAELGSDAASKWANYRLKVGEYYYRVASPDGIRMALTEFRAAVELDPTNGQAQGYIDQIINHQNILGLARDVDVVPNFTQYQDFVTNYSKLVEEFFSIANQNFQTAATTVSITDGVQRERTHLLSLSGILNTELKAAQMGQQVAADDNKSTDSRLADLQQRVQAKKQELDNTKIDLPGAIFSTVGIVVGIIAAIPTGGSSLLAIAPAVLTLVKDINSTGVAEIIDDIQASPTDDIKKEKIAQLEKEAGSIGNAVKGTVNTVKQLLNFNTMLHDLWSAHTNNQEYITLLTQLAELVHTQLLARLHKQQADYEVQAVQENIQQVKQDIKAVEDQLTKIAASINVLDYATQTLISSVQRCVDLICKWAFFAARALEIYTLDDLSNEIRYDYGYIHPDMEQDWEEGFLGRIDLMTVYQNSWRTLLNIASYSDKYLSYFRSGNPSRALHQLSFTDATVLANFKQTAKMPFTVNLQDLPANHFEAKVEYVLVSLIGAKATTTTFECIVEHSGKCALKKRDGTEVDMFLRPQRTSAILRLKPLDPNDLPSPLTDPLIAPMTIAFWGRGIATTWYLSLQKDDITRYAVDLTKLTEIKVWIGYQCFLQ